MSFTRKILKNIPLNRMSSLFLAGATGVGTGISLVRLDSDKSIIKKTSSQEVKNNNSLKYSLDNLIEQSQVFCRSKLLQEVLGIGQITKTTNPKEFFVQILSRELGAMIKTKTYYLDEEKQTKIIQDIFTDIDKAVELDPVEPTPFQVAVTFNGTKALMTYRFAHQLWQDNRTEDALTLSNAALSNYHVNIHPSADIKAGVFIDHAFGVNIKKNTTIDTGTYILHKVKIGENVTIGKNVFIGAGAKISSNTKVGDNALIGAGTHVIADIPHNGIAFGLYTQSGSAKIMPSSRHIQMPKKIQDGFYRQETTQNNNKSIKALKSLIPFNPNSPLTVSNLKDFYQKSCHSYEREEQTIGNLALTASHIAYAAWTESLSNEYTENEKTSFGNFGLWLQGRMATLFKVDIHPAAELGHNIQFPQDINKGIVIGSTATVGNNTYISDGVTLGGNGKDRGDRHPKIAENCYLGEDAIILGAGTLGAGCIVMPNSVLSLPKNSQTPDSKVYSGKPAIDITTDCHSIPACKSFLDALKKQKQKEYFINLKH